MKSLLVLGLILVAASSIGLGQTDEDLAKIAKEAFAARARAGGLTNKEDAVQAFERPFRTLEDAQRVRALALSLYAIDESDPKWSMSASIVMGTSYALGDDPDFISDWSALRQMLKNEKDPRKFYLLSNLVPRTRDRERHDFVEERIHMLFADGRVAKEEGEYTRTYAHDVSEYAYTAIVGNLRALGADFEPPAKNLPHEQQAVILANWLKENWPGCENIEIPRRPSGVEPRPRKAFVEKVKPSSAQTKELEQEKPHEANAENESRLPWFIAGVSLVAILALIFKVWKGKSER